MIDEEMCKMLRKLTVLAGCLNAVIDAGNHEHVSTDIVTEQIEHETIFILLNSLPDFGWSTGMLSVDDQRHLLGEWQSMANAIDAQRKLGVSNSGLCLLLAYVIEGIQMRTFSKVIWPGPEPFTV